MLVSFPAGQFLQRRTRRMPWILGSLALYRAGFLLVALTPLIHIAGLSQGTLVVILLVATSAPAQFFNVGFLPMLATIIPEDKRAAVFTARNMVVNASLSLCVFLIGQWLSRVSFPINYQVMYVFGFLTSLLSLFFLVKLQVPDSVSTQPEKGPVVPPSVSTQPPVRRLVSQAAPDFQRRPRRRAA